MSTRIKEVAEDIDAEAGRFSAEISSLKAEVMRLARRLGEDEAELASRVKSMAGDVTGEFRRVEGDIVKATRDNPWKWLGIAAILGVIVGLVVRR
jgi:ElaB/YqjD/DUF883 family membrane-anchored ribosome-binding protein